jgi:cytochrome b
MSDSQAKESIRVWDLPIRLFHWLLVLSVVGLFVTGKLGGNWLEWHKLLGFFTLGLLVFRVVWGGVGNEHARFANFVRGPRAIIAYLRHGTHAVGHNPLGALSVLAMLAVLLFQALSGLFADDDIMMRGPYANAVSGAISAQLTKLHKLNADIILILVGVHVAAIAFYFFVKRENLVKPMITGEKSLSGAVFEAKVTERARPVWFSWVVAITSGVATYLVVTRAFG